MAGEILRGIVKIGRPTKVGGSYVLIERMNSPDEMYFRLASSRSELRATPRKHLTFPRRKS